MTKDEYIQYLKQELAWYQRLCKSLFIALLITSIVDFVALIKAFYF